MVRDSITIVGASLAGLRAAETLRRDGFSGRISLIGAEVHAPYDRPPLSKQVLAGAWEADRTVLTPADRLELLGLDMRLGRRATGLDLSGRILEVDGVSESYDGLLIATGARCRTLPGTGHLAGVHTLRTLDDSLAICKRHAADRHLARLNAVMIRALEIIVRPAAEIGKGDVFNAVAAEPLVRFAHRPFRSSVQVRVTFSKEYSYDRSLRICRAFNDSHSPTLHKARLVKKSEVLGARIT